MRGIFLRNISILLKGIICGLVYLVFHLLIIPAEYVLNLSLYSALVLGILCGIVIAAISYCSTAKRTIITMIAGFLSAVTMSFILLISGVPYKILTHIFKDDEFMRELGHLTVNELIEYNWGYYFYFLPGFLITFIVLIILIPALIVKKSRLKKA